MGLEIERKIGSIFSSVIAAAVGSKGSKIIKMVSLASSFWGWDPRRKWMIGCDYHHKFLCVLTIASIFASNMFKKKDNKICANEER